MAETNSNIVNSALLTEGDSQLTEPVVNALRQNDVEMLKKKWPSIQVDVESLRFEQRNCNEKSWGLHLRSLC